MAKPREKRDWVVVLWIPLILITVSALAVPLVLGWFGADDNGGAGQPGSDPTPGASLPTTTERVPSTTTSTPETATVTSTVAPDQSTSSSLELSDATIKDSESPVVVVKVRNTGDEVVVVTRAVFEITDYSMALLTGQLVTSASYQVRFPAQTGPQELELPQTVSLSLSQEVDSGDADQFEIIIGVADDAFVSQHLYTFRMMLRYNRQDETGWSEPLRITVDHPQPVG